MNVVTAAAAPLFKNGYLVSCEATGEAVLIDPGDEVDELIASAHARRLNVRAILLTHAHFDHVSGVGRAKAEFQVPIWLHPDDLYLYDIAPAQARLFGLETGQPPPVDCFYEPGARVVFGHLVADVLPTPGHCPGGVCLAIGPAGASERELFVGDTLFAGSIGRTDLPGGDFTQLMRSIGEVLLRFPDATPVHPGHGPSTTIGDERASNPYLTGQE
jgi:glyoxylase-like metal-dependent hydrolase (beta-lactamase superfamily II)